MCQAGIFAMPEGPARSYSARQDMMPNPRKYLDAILSAKEPHLTFEAARALGDQGIATLPVLYEALREEAPARGEPALWGLTSAIHWVLYGYLETTSQAGTTLDEQLLFRSVNELGDALAGIRGEMEGAAIKLGAVLGDELPRACSE